MKSLRLEMLFKIVAWVLIDGFYEWKWLDEKGKHKQKYLITLPTHEAFACAGLYSHWTNKNTGETIKTYTILTTEANELMSEIQKNVCQSLFILQMSKVGYWEKPISLPK